MLNIGNFYKNLSEQHQAFALIAVGTLALLFGTGVIKGLGLAADIFGIYLIVIALIKLDIHKKVQALLAKKK